CSHLYVFPTFQPQHVMAFCEGLMGAIIAAQNGIAVASIKGCRCYRRSPIGKGKPYRVLAELLGVDFGGRAVYYIPDLDVKEKTRAEVEKAAPQAAKWLIEKQNGTPYIARLPEDAEDLDKWLLSMEEHERVTELVKLTQTAITPKQWKGEKEDAASGEEPEQSDSSEEEQPPSHVNGTRKEGTGAVRRTQGGVATATQEEQPESPAEDSSQVHPETTRSSESQTVQKKPIPEATAPQHSQRRYKPIPKTNFGEFMVGLIYGGVAGIAFVMVMLFAAPELEPTSFIARVPEPITIILGLIITAAVLRFMVRRQYVRRWYALRDHLAGKH
ncbi:MAG: DUF3854 domain-containing protein, partial [Rubrobacter sp.]|nr:DUF3854 domain-containing protein [Rubrobacter sp.]